MQHTERDGSCECIQAESKLRRAAGLGMTLRNSMLAVTLGELVSTWKYEDTWNLR